MKIYQRYQIVNNTLIRKMCKLCLHSKYTKAHAVIDFR